MRALQKKFLSLLGGVVLVLVLGFFWTQQSLTAYSHRWTKNISNVEDSHSLYIPSPVEAFILGQTPMLWEKKWGPENPPEPRDLPDLFTEARSFAENDSFYINTEEWELGRILSSFANSQNVELLKDVLEFQGGTPRVPKEWEVQNCDILYQEFYFRLYQVEPSQRELALRELTRCDPQSPSRLWVLTDALKAFSGPHAQELLSEIKKISLMADLRPYRRWFAEELFKLGYFIQKKGEI